MYLLGTPAPLVLPCVTVAVRVVPVPLCFSPSRSSLIHLPSPSQQTPVDGKEGQGKCQRKNDKNLTINQILPFVIPNLSPAAWNRDKRRRAKRVKEKEQKTRGSGGTYFFVYRPISGRANHARAPSHHERGPLHGGEQRT